MCLALQRAQESARHPHLRDGHLRDVAMEHEPSDRGRERQHLWCGESKPEGEGVKGIGCEGTREMKAGDGRHA